MLLAKAREVLNHYFGYSGFRTRQEEIVKSLLAGEDCLAIMPTGAGKSICYQIPALLLPGVTLVISPLISLMKDQVDSLREAGIAASFINSSLSAKEVERRIIAASQGEYRLLYVAPERLESDAFIDNMTGLDIALLAIDEAHCVSQWGHDFRPSYRRILNFVKKLKNRPVVAAFTATATDEVQQDIVKLLGLNNPKFFISGFDRPNLSYQVLKGINKERFLLQYLKDHPDDFGIIYAATRKEVDKIYEMLTENGWRAGKYHAGMRDKERNQVQEDFVFDNIQVMVATNAFGMGIDKSNVRFVIHYNLPKNMESYYQEAGRAGRDGEPSECILLFSPQDIIIQKFLIEQSVYSPVRKKNEYRKLQVMVDYVHTSRCLRQTILEYFGDQDLTTNCGNCGNCNSDSELVEITETAQKIISCVLRMKEQYGITTVAEVLKGSKSKKITGQRFERLSTYGIMREKSLIEIKDLINYLIAEDYLYLTESNYPVVKVQPKAIEVVKGNSKVYQKVLMKKEAPSDDKTLFQRLRVLRKELAMAEGVPPYIIFSDKTLHEISERLPVTLTELADINGIGAVKLERYGQQFLTVVQEFVHTSNQS
jgi:ATP-dependent DNA helicase RecQ